MTRCKCRLCKFLYCTFAKDDVSKLAKAQKQIPNWAKSQLK